MSVMHYTPYPFRFIRTTHTVTDSHLHLYETMRTYRPVYMDGRSLSRERPDVVGHSVGRHEKDTLVIDTVGFNDKVNATRTELLVATAAMDL